MLLWLVAVDFMSNGDNSRKLFTLLVYLIHSRVGRGPMRRGPTHGLPFEFEAVGVVDQAIQDGVGVGGVADLVMPAIQRDLVATMVEPRPWRSSTTSIRSRRCSDVSLT